jgi:hypothetical protein
LLDELLPLTPWANPVERIMSIVNLGMQCVGVMRSKGSDVFENVLEKCNNLKEIRQSCSLFKEELAESIKPTKELIASVLKRLELKGKKFEVFESAQDEEIKNFWKILQTIDCNLTTEDTTQRSKEKLTALQNFISHCCIFHKYSLTIKKCGSDSCSICLPVRMPPEMFKGKF